MCPGEREPVLGHRGDTSAPLGPCPGLLGRTEAVSQPFLLSPPSCRCLRLLLPVGTNPLSSEGFIACLSQKLLQLVGGEAWLWQLHVRRTLICAGQALFSGLPAKPHALCPSRQLCGDATHAPGFS